MAGVIRSLSRSGLLSILKLGSEVFFVAFAALIGRVLGALAFPCSGFGAFPCIVSGLLALPLCGAALTFFAAAKKDKQRKRLKPLMLSVHRGLLRVVVHLESVLARVQR